MKRVVRSIIGVMIFSMFGFAGVHANVPGSGNRFFDDRYRIVSTYGDAIASAARRFDIPAQILVGVILTESGGDPWAVTQLSSAKGLMQTIDTTFGMAWKALGEQGIHIKRTPFHPESSIMAGAWYLDQMYRRAVSDGRADPGLRHDPAAWQMPLEYYYAGPENGLKAANRIQVCSRGNCRTIDKSAYSAKVLGFAGGGRRMNFETASLAEPQVRGGGSVIPADRDFLEYRVAGDRGFD